MGKLSIGTAYTASSWLRGISAAALISAGCGFAVPAFAEDSAALETAAAAAEAVTADEAQQGTTGQSVQAAYGNDIVVTARRRSETAQQVPIAISVIGGEQIDSTGAFNVGRLQQLAPTIQFYTSNPRNSAVNIRGIGAPFGLTNDGIEQGVGIYVDDVYYARVASATLDFLDVAQIEVLRGPQGTLYGKNTTAGAVNITSNQPTFDFEGKAELSIGNLNFKQAKAAVSGPITENLAARIAISSTSRRGTLYNVTSDQHIQSQDNIGIRGQLLWKPASDIEVTVAGDWNRQEAVCCGSVYVRTGATQRPINRQYAALAGALGYTVPSTNPYDRLSDVDATLNAGNDLGGASLRVKWDVGGGTLTSVTAWRFWDWRPENDRDFTGLSIVSKSQNPSQQNQYTQELRYNYSGEKFDFVLGGFGFYQRIDTQGTEQHGKDSSRWTLSPTAALNGGALLINDPSVLEGLTAINTQYLKNTSVALFGQLSWNVSDQFTIQPGVRVNYDKKDGFYQRRVYLSDGTEIFPSAITPGGGLTGDAKVINDARIGVFAPQEISPSFSDWNFSYDLTANYKVTPDVLLYGSYAKTFKSGGINQNGVPADANNNPILETATIKPESVNSFELGVKTQFWDRRATFNLAAFRTDIKNYQANVNNGQFGVLRGYLANAGKVRTQGLEADFSVRPSERFNAYVNAAYTDAKYEKFVDAPCPPELSGGTTVGAGQTPSAPGVPGLSPANCDISGQRLPGVSKWALSFGFEANTQSELFGEAGQFYFGYDGSYRSKFSSNPSPSAYTWIDGYALSNFRAGFRAERGVEIYGWVRNAFAKDYMDQLFVGPGNTGLITGLPGDPRTWGGTIKGRF